MEGGTCGTGVTQPPEAPHLWMVGRARGLLLQLLVGQLRGEMGPAWGVTGPEGR